MSLTRTSSQFTLDMTERTTACLPRDNPLINRSGKGRKTLNGVYDNASFYSTEYTGAERVQLFNNCTLELGTDGGRADAYGIYHPLYIEPHALNVVDGLWMSDQYTATDERALRALGVTHIISVHDSYTLPRFPEQLIRPGCGSDGSGNLVQVRSVYWPATTQRAPNAQRLEEQKRQLINARSWIQELLLENRNRKRNGKGNVVLVHSMRGQARAALVVLAALVPLLGSDALEPCLRRMSTLWSRITLDESTKRVLEELTAGCPCKSINAEIVVQSMFSIAYDTRTGQEMSTTGPYARPSPKVVRVVHFEPPPPPPQRRPIRRDNSSNYSAIVYPAGQPSEGQASTSVNVNTGTPVEGDLGSIVEEEEDDTETEVGDAYDVGLALEPTLMLDEIVGPDPVQAQATLSVEFTGIFVGKTPFTTPAGSFVFDNTTRRVDVEDAVWRLNQLAE